MWGCSHSDLWSETALEGGHWQAEQAPGDEQTCCAHVCWGNGGWRPEAGPLSLHHLSRTTGVRAKLAAALLAPIPSHTQAMP